MRDIWLNLDQENSALPLPRAIDHRARSSSVSQPLSDDPFSRMLSHQPARDGGPASPWIESLRATW